LNSNLKFAFCLCFKQKRISTTSNFQDTIFFFCSLRSILYIYLGCCKVKPLFIYNSTEQTDKAIVLHVWSTSGLFSVRKIVIKTFLSSILDILIVFSIMMLLFSFIYTKEEGDDLISKTYAWGGYH
jgi:hypothetical protein